MLPRKLYSIAFALLIGFTPYSQKTIKKWLEMDDKKILARTKMNIMGLNPQNPDQYYASAEPILAYLRILSDAHVFPDPPH